MDNYIGVKLIRAEPAERDGKPGYKVVYPDGYESWSPKDVFESAYCLVPKDLTYGLQLADDFPGLNTVSWRPYILEDALDFVYKWGQYGLRRR